MTAVMIGYARTSTTDQKAGLEAQLRDLETAGCTKIFKEQLSSVATERPELERALDFVREGDVMVVTKLDRLARSVADLIAITEKLRRKGVELRILALNLDTSTPTGKLMLNLLGSIAEFERELMLERQREGIAKAKAEGKYKGRAPTARSKAEKVLSLKAEGMTPLQIQSTLGISRASYFRIVKEADNVGQANHSR
ncbi:recombinase family protein [Rhizobium lentis]|uniref:recombinase family protein n=1 Tax=Rhizobium lentis TaxID=1138194 RepID=UPI001C831909|nr:recombinase family protein [Rhizobium lentis]MBX4972625.1 recombinase family protein [Rhizobium lentis]MBX5086233.1 recombinase family protein [Rhizobium lentis]MBX5096345.1 recombinase family protein [Rhizobium lentis]MBX5123513.1 recombinase family protein [Rhizobium lentis]